MSIICLLYLIQIRLNLLFSIVGLNQQHHWFFLHLLTMVVLLVCSVKEETKSADASMVQFGEDLGGARVDRADAPVDCQLQPEYAILCVCLIACLLSLCLTFSARVADFVACTTNFAALRCCFSCFHNLSFCHRV